MPTDDPFTDDDVDCPHACDYCQPDMWHRCVLRRGHTGPHTCGQVW